MTVKGSLLLQQPTSSKTSQIVSPLEEEAVAMSQTTELFRQQARAQRTQEAARCSPLAEDPREQVDVVRATDNKQFALFHKYRSLSISCSFFFVLFIDSHKLEV